MIDLVCVVCARPFQALRSTARYCDATCRQRAKRACGVSSVAALPEPTEAEPDLVAATRRELLRAKREDSVLGQQALALALRLSTGAADTGSAVASLSKELRAVMAEAMAGVPAAPDLLDQLAARRVQKASGA